MKALRDVAVEERRCEIGLIRQLLGEMKAGQEPRQIAARRGEGGLICAQKLLKSQLVAWYRQNCRSFRSADSRR